MACSAFPRSVNWTRKYELFQKNIWIVPEKIFSCTIHIFFSYSSYKFIFSGTIDRSREHTTYHFLQMFIIYYRLVYTSIIQQNILQNICLPWSKQAIVKIKVFTRYVIYDLCTFKWHWINAEYIKSIYYHIFVQINDFQHPKMFNFLS